MAVNSFNAQNPPVTTKGDVFTFSTIPTRLGVGANDTVLTADSSTSTGLKWAAPASGGMTSIASGSLSSTTVTISSISGTYRNLVLVIKDIYVDAGSNKLALRINGDSTSNYRYVVMRGGVSTLDAGNGQSSLRLSGDTTNLPTTAQAISYIVSFSEYSNTTYHPIIVQWNHNNGDAGFTFGQQDAITAAITSLTIFTSASANFSGGTYILYGVK